MSKISWYWHRLRAMSPREMTLHARKKLRQAADSRRQLNWASAAIQMGGAFPRLPLPNEAPRSVREALAIDTDEILAGRWRAFGHLPIQVDDPPHWHTDYLAKLDLSTGRPAFEMDHRSLPKGADVKLIWELSRWYQLVRLAMAAYVLGDRRAAEKCVVWLEDWVRQNPPYRGWNWTSALEAGMRLIQFTWIDALLTFNASDWDLAPRLNALRTAILPPHVWFTWRYQSFGSSANNHLLGEIVGLITATARWPALANWGASLERLSAIWEREVKLQFGEDGGNREQALSYQLFSFEFCWQARMALHGAGQTIPDSVERRLAAAAAFLHDVQVDSEQWDYGDSDNASVTPFFAADSTRVSEWRRWAAGLESESISYWIGAPSCDPPAQVRMVRNWHFYPQSGIAVAKPGLWQLRWDLSPLGYLSTAAHGHLDALHLSIWYQGTAFVVDPGTGAYYADKDRRSWLASRNAHNGPATDEAALPQRLGPFLWSGHHASPQLDDQCVARLDLGAAIMERSVTTVPRLGNASKEERIEGWAVEDRVKGRNGSWLNFSVRWQFAPGTLVQRVGERRFELKRNDRVLTVDVSQDWSDVLLVEQSNGGVEGMVSPAFRRIEWAPCLKLVARPQGSQPCLFRTTFVASAAP